MELSQPDTSGKISTVNGWPYKVCLYGATIINIVIIFHFFKEEGWKRGAVVFSASVIFFLIAPLIWGVGNWVRKFIKPDAYFTYGNKDAFKKRIFWLVGPQWTGLWMTWIFVIYLSTLLAQAVEKGEVVSAPVQAEKVKTSEETMPLPALSALSAVPAVLAASAAMTEPTPSAPEVSEEPAATPEFPAAPVPNSQNALPSTFAVIAPAESQQMLTAMLQQPTSAFKISEIKGKIEALPKLPSGDRKAARSLNDQGLAALKNDDFIQATTLLKSAVSKDPADVEVLNNYVYALIKAKRLQDAELEAGRLLTMSSGRSSAWANLAEVYALKENNQAAAAALILAFQFSSNKDRTLTFLNERAADSGSPLHEASKTALETIQKM